MNGLEWIRIGGPVVWVIVFCLLLAVAVFLERMFHLRRAQIAFHYFMKGVFNVLRRGNVDEAISLCDDTPGPIARLMRTAILHRDAGGDALAEELATIGRIETSRMERRLAVISTIAQMTPLLGLVGTLLGILDAVSAVRDHSPLVDAHVITDSVIKAIVTSIFGLLAAIPAHVMFNTLVVRIDRIVQEMDEATSDIKAFFADWSKGGGREAEDARP